ncbi:UDP-3-O-acylglucosamine N-acyltransferase [Chlamydiales bacterium STE3]|nr:UDP-3-O-acylglucosamine N-acyltransferase [Chlamydiales bacterium STE3]
MTKNPKQSLQLSKVTQKEASMFQKSYSLEELAHLTQSKISGNAQHRITNVADLETAKADDASFLANPRYEQMMKRSEAGVIFIDDKTPLMDGRNFLVTENPSRAFQKIVELFSENASELTGFEGIHPTAIVHPSAKVASNVAIGPFAVIDKNVILEKSTTIGAHVYIGPNSVLGESCLIHPHVTIRERCLIGNRVTIQPGAVIGSCGFGYTTDKEGRHIKLNQVGTVTIEDDVEIGANTTIDRSRFKTTKIGRGSKVDNLVQIGHGVEVGQDNIIIGQTGIAGSTKTGRHVVLAGQVAVAGHLKLADGVVVAGCSGVSKSLQKPGKYGGIPAIPLEDYNRNAVQLRSIQKYYERIKSLEERLAKLEN